MRKVQCENGKYYHVYNRGVDKRSVFLDARDQKRFFQSMEEFNVIDPIGSIYVNSFRKQKIVEARKENLVNFICYCLNQNHFHIVLKQTTNGGISEFMKRISSGYTTHFNFKYRRSFEIR